MNDDIFRPDWDGGAERVPPEDGAPVEVPEIVEATPAAWEPTPLDDPALGFAVDGTDAFAIDERVTEPLAEDDLLEVDAAAGSRARLAVLVGAALAGLLIVVTVGSSTGPRPVIGEAGRLSELGTEESSTTLAEGDELYVDRRAEKFKVEQRPGYDGDDEVTADPYATDPFGTSDTFTEDGNVDYSLFDDEDPFEIDEYIPARGRSPVPRRNATVTSTTRPPLRTTTTSTATATTQVEETSSTSTSSTLTSSSSSTTSSSTSTSSSTTSSSIPDGPKWESRTTGLPVTCAASLRLWSAGGGLVASLTGVGAPRLFTSAGTGGWTAQSTEPLIPQAFVADPQHPATFWLAGDSGLFRSDDGGATLTELGSLVDVSSFAVDTADPARSTLLAVTGEGSLQRSSNRGATWSSAVLPPQVTDVTSVAFADTQHAYLGAAQGIFASADGGATWAASSVFPGAVSGQPVRVGTTITWLLADGGGVAVSPDGGLTWSSRGQTGTIASNATSIVLDATGRLVTIGAAVGGVTKLVASSDGGATWEPIDPPTPFAPSGIAQATVGTFVWNSGCTDGSSETQAVSLLVVP